MADSSTLLDVLKRELLVSATATDNPQIANDSISVAFADYYLDSNYGLGGVELPTKVKILMPLKSGEVDAYNYPATAAAMFGGTGTTTYKFGTIKDIGSFVQSVAYITYSEGEVKEGFNGKLDITDPEVNSEALTEFFGMDTVSPTEGSKLKISKYITELVRPIIAKGYTKETAPKTSDGNSMTLEEVIAISGYSSALILRPWLAYQYIDYVPIGTEKQKYDSFLETQVRQLTKVVFVANLLRAAYKVASNAAKPAITTAFNDVIRLPDIDITMLGEFLAKGGPKNLDKMYQDNVKKSAELYNAATDLEVNDAKMRQAQDNLRAINTNDELMTSVRRRAFILYIVVCVMMAALVGALSLALATGNSGVMYTTIAVVCVLVLLTEVTRGIGRILRV